MDTWLLVAVVVCWVPAMGVILIHDRELYRQDRALRAGDPDTFVL